jgi:spore coat polysaccharide biosynthesis protein SpsF
MITAIIQARMGSTRLPGKVLKKIKGKTLLEILVERLRQAKKIDQIIIATSTDKKNLAIVKLAKKINCPYFIGNENDVLDRVYQAAKKFKAQTIIRVTADCPFHDPELVDQIVEFYLKNKSKYDYVSNVDPPSFPDGLDLWIIPFKTLERAWKEAKLTSEREHVCPYIWKNPHLFKIGHFESKKDYSHLRWTVDDIGDFNFIKKIYEKLYKKGKIFHMKDILDLLKKHPELHKTQEGKIRDAGYLKSVKNDKKIKP